jgi:glycosyltransferase involved in cell wall biosynthesis
MENGASVIVATYKRPELLDRCLTALLGQSAMMPFEIIVSEQGGDPETKNVLWKHSSDKRLKVLDLVGKPLTQARNAAISAAKYGLVIIMDDDCMAAPDWLTAITEPFKDADVGVITSFSEFGGTSTAFRKVALDKAGYFDENFRVWPLSFAFREDADLLFRVLDTGCKYVITKEARFEHVHKQPVGLTAKIKYVLRRAWLHQTDVLLYKKHPLRSTQQLNGYVLLNVKYGFWIPFFEDFKKATGLWHHDKKMMLSSPQGVKLLEASNPLTIAVVLSGGLFYAAFIKLVRLIGSVRYGKLLL